MASAFGHAAAALAIGRVFSPQQKVSLYVWGIVLSILPDSDSLGFALGIPYESFWGHRGFSHSIVFACIAASAVAITFYRSLDQITKWKITVYLFFCTISHALLDAMTTGGLGVAFFAPFDNSRYFFPFRPIKVSPISVAAFFNGRGWIVIRSEAIWIGIPAMSLICIVLLSDILKRKG